ncbi:MAG: M48 family metalloprotease, partial [Thermoplasmata archaeon]|nr:M48 family metalloprotease [Thermoplasmata archaeon]
KEQLTAIVGHELGHIVNNDATVITIFNPMMMFTLAVRGFFEIVVRAIIFLMVTVGKFGKRSIIGLLIAVVLLLFLVVVLIYVGFYYVTFYILTMAVVLSWYLLSRQKEYAADLFGSLVSGSQYSMGLSLMELVRESGLDEIKGNMTKKIIEERLEKAKGQQPDEEAPEAAGPKAEVTIEAEESPDGDEASVEEPPEAKAAPEAPEDKDEEPPEAKKSLEKTVGQEKDLQPGQLTQEEKMEIFNSIDIYKAVTEDPELYAQISMRDAKVLCETKGLESFDKDDFSEFGKFEYTSREKMGELTLSHPLFGKRVKDLTQISLTQDEGQKETPDPENE